MPISPTTSDSGPLRAPTPPLAESDHLLQPRPSRRIPLAVIVAGVIFGLACGAFEITNTSIGWHIASGRWMLDHGEILDHDPFSFTSGGVEWIDHEWLFQIFVAGLFEIGGAPLLVLMRMLVIAALMILLIRIASSSGLDPPVALLLAAVCVAGARPRFFLRPELFTLLLLPLACWIFADRRGRRWWLVSLVAVIALGANLHGGILIAPLLLAVWFSGEVLDQAMHSPVDRGFLFSGAGGVALAFAAPLLNPHGAAIWTVPFTLAKMVRLPHIPNPEWISPGPSDAPVFYLGMAAAALILAVKSRSPQHWLGTAAVATLALRHIRNVGLFFVLLPQTLAPALARLPQLAGDGPPEGSRSGARRAICFALVILLGVGIALRPWPAAGFRFADNWYPDRAFGFLETHGLDSSRLYNDVRFGGWLILNGYPDRRVFLDDRNEIHEPLLREIWEIFSSSDVSAWEQLLDRFMIDTVLLRYHEPIKVTTPDGRDLGRRGFSTLWLRPSRWALVYWDDVAMVLVRRSSVSEAMLGELEYRVVRPDDLEHLSGLLRLDLKARGSARIELERALAMSPDCRRAQDLAGFVESFER